MYEKQKEMQPYFMENNASFLIDHSSFLKQLIIFLN